VRSSSPSPSRRALAFFRPRGGVALPRLCSLSLRSGTSRLSRARETKSGFASRARSPCRSAVGACANVAPRRLLARRALRFSVLSVIQAFTDNKSVHAVDSRSRCPSRPLARRLSLASFKSGGGSRRIRSPKTHGSSSTRVTISWAACPTRSPASPQLDLTKSDVSAQQNSPGFVNRIRSTQPAFRQGSMIGSSPTRSGRSRRRTRSPARLLLGSDQCPPPGQRVPYNTALAIATSDSLAIDRRPGVPALSPGRRSRAPEKPQHRHPSVFLRRRARQARWSQARRVHEVMVLAWRAESVGATQSSPSPSASRRTTSTPGRGVCVASRPTRLLSASGICAAGAACPGSTPPPRATSRSRRFFTPHAWELWHGTMNRSLRAPDATSPAGGTAASLARRTWCSQCEHRRLAASSASMSAHALRSRSANPHLQSRSSTSRSACSARGVRKRADFEKAVSEPRARITGSLRARHTRDPFPARRSSKTRSRCGGADDKAPSTSPLSPCLELRTTHPSRQAHLLRRRFWCPAPCAPHAHSARAVADSSRC